MKKFLDNDGVLYLWSKIKTLVSGKVDNLKKEIEEAANTLAFQLGLRIDDVEMTKQDKEEGKGLSSNDFTAAEKAKLAGLENYTLPAATADTLGGVKVGAGLNIVGGVLSATGGGGGGSIPARGIIFWSGDTIPEGWALCDGNNGTPDLRDKFVLGAGEKHTVGETGGSEEVTLTVEQMPEHSHKVAYETRSDLNSGGSSKSVNRVGTGSVIANTEASGKTDPHPNMPPYYVLYYIMKL